MTIRGSYCESAALYGGKSHFAAGSFRWKASGKARILVGCPRGQWSRRAKRCKVGMTAYKILTPTPASGRCPVRTRKITKG